MYLIALHSKGQSRYNVNSKMSIQREETGKYQCSESLVQTQICWSAFCTIERIAKDVSSTHLIEEKAELSEL